MRLHHTLCVREGAEIPWVRASGWGPNVIFPIPVAAPSRVFPACEPKSSHKSADAESLCSPEVPTWKSCRGFLLPGSFVTQQMPFFRHQIRSEARYINTLAGQAAGRKHL